MIAIENESIFKLLFPESPLVKERYLYMLKFTSLALGLLTAISIVPSAQALPISGTPVIVTQTYRGDRTPVVVNVTHPTYRGSKYYRGWETDRRRQIELIRQREARARWEARHSRYRHDRNRYSTERYIDYRRDNNSYGDRRDYRY
ncbi:hypothetical protein [Chamaesiphon minutus]|uniref:Uncharacterized protein n=1 Tax=Chamaesiphon minutus (strain ATCC 27169 / PCC 6605) TaxID=1173020 RepID=K9UPZ4_CHAP6|nr:hypothetical protein [Chamaesiphon minutus]AFY96259.1 hypothetical protein Cha6605_5372 [Chamaesiphon minutus PCC 6605]